MPSTTVTLCKFVGTISLGLLTGLSTTLSALTLPALLTLPTAPTAHTTLSHLRARTTTLSTYLRGITSFAVFSAYLLSPRRLRHPYLLYTSILAFASGPGVDYVLGGEGGKEVGGEEVNGEMVRRGVERMRWVEGVRAGVVGTAFGMAVVGIWGDGV
ncbi:hypothetical protein EJ04DRAFT_542624 [Polyplosphaeria fusca]|uniref:Uncharacterized protein n=1 Tax=Polyplosphaeria fusca TaxID=682080 RepID=A0A9P4QYK0_9PLEO|nr:hypothetical protein EJ04DRAFT_542624 [Polyplosphaeria fusca]